MKKSSGLAAVAFGFLGGGVVLAGWTVAWWKSWGFAGDLRDGSFVTRDAPMGIFLFALVATLVYVVGLALLVIDAWSPRRKPLWMIGAIAAVLLVAYGVAWRATAPSRARAQRDVAEAKSATRAKTLRLPVNAFASAEVGDWNELSYVVEGRDRDLEELVARCRVEAIDGDTVTISMDICSAVTGKALDERVRGGLLAVGTRTFSRSRGPAWSELFDRPFMDLGEVATGPATVAFAGKTLHGQRLFFKDAGNAVEVVVSSEVKGAGIVSARFDGRPRESLALRAYGTGAGVVSSSVTGVADALPLNPFADAQPGDWSVLAVDGRMGLSGLRGLTYQTYEVAAVESDQVVVNLTRPEGEQPRVLQLSKRFAPSLRTLEIEPLRSIKDCTVDETTIKIGERSFPCDRIRFSAIEDMGSRDIQAAVSVSREVRAGIVAFVATEPSGRSRPIAELVAFGARGATAWRAPPPPDALPENPLGRAVVGDWARYKTTPSGRPASSFKVVEATGEAVALVTERGNVPWGYSTRWPLSCAGLFDWSSSPRTATGGAVEEATLEVGGRSFACKKLTFTAAGEYEKTCRGTVWYCGEVKPIGVVRAELEGSPYGREELEIASYGTAERTLFGAR